MDGVKVTKNAWRQIAKLHDRVAENWERRCEMHYQRFSKSAKEFHAKADRYEQKQRKGE